MNVRHLDYIINDQIELNLSYMTFISNGGLFIPTNETIFLGEIVKVRLSLPTKKEPIEIEGKVVWLTPRNALHHVLPGIGIQFIGQDTSTIRSVIESHLDANMEVGGYTYGITSDTSMQK